MRVRWWERRGRPRTVDPHPFAQERRLRRRALKPSPDGRGSERGNARLSVLVRPGDARGVGAHGQGGDRRAALGLEEVQTLTGRIGEPDAAVVETRGQQAVLRLRGNEVDQTAFVEADLGGLAAHWT